MDQLSNFISEYLKTCETIKKLNSKTIKAYRKRQIASTVTFSGGCFAATDI